MKKIWTLWLKNSFGNRMGTPRPFTDPEDALAFLSEALKNGYGLAEISINENPGDEQLDFVEQVRSGQVDLMKGFPG